MCILIFDSNIEAPVFVCSGENDQPFSVSYLAPIYPTWRLCTLLGAYVPYLAPMYPTWRLCTLLGAYVPYLAPIFDGQVHLP